MLMLERIAHPKIRKQIVDTKVAIEEIWEPPETREAIERDLDEHIHIAATKTRISHDDSHPTTNTIPLKWTLHGQRPSIQQLSVVEAHEKGHLIRPYGLYGDFFKTGFDSAACSVDESRLQAMREMHPTESNEALRESVVEAILNPMEIAERMAQLKNYFGMKGDELFTSEHLAYARVNYIRDTGLDNDMTLFFQAITPETEPEFIRLINSAGI